MLAASCWGSIFAFTSPGLRVLTLRAECSLLAPKPAHSSCLLPVGDQPCIEDALPITRRIKATIEMEIGAFEVQPHLSGDLLQRAQALRKQHHVGLIDRRHGDRREDVAMMIRYGDDLLPRLVLVARVPDAIAPFLATVLVPSPCRMLVSRCFSAARWRTLARNACHSDPSSAHLANTLEMVV
jgi:hypothetical protein